MAQQTAQNPTSNLPPIPSTEEWDKILDQLEKIDTLGNNVWHTAARVDELQDNVENIRKLTNIDQDEESAVDEKQNVIDKKQSVPATLTSSEKKRYESIGQQFVKGAGKQFQRIKKAIEMKQKMKTSKSQKVVQDIKKADTKIKKEKTSKGGFWKKLLGVVVVLGAVAFLFRDKIAKLLPDLSGGMSGLGQKIQSTFSGLIQHLVTVCVGFIGGGLSGIITFVCTKIIPTTIDGFFRDTLPMVMVASTLAVLSLFSEGAGGQLQALLGKSASNKTYSDESAANAQVTAHNAQVEAANAKIDQLNDATQADLAAKRQQLIKKNYNAQTTDENFKAIRQQLSQFEEATGIKINTLIENEDVNLITMMQALQKAQYIEDSAEKQKTIQQILQSHLGNLTDDQIQKIQSYVNSNTSDLIRISGLLVNHQQYKALDSQIKKASAAKVTTQLTVDATSPPTPLSFVTQINVQGAILASVADKIATVMASIDNFVNGKGQDDFIDKVKGFFNVVGNLCQYLVQEYVATLFEILKYAERVIYSDGSTGSLGEGQTKVVHVYGENTGQATPNGTQNVLVLNLHDHSSEKLNQFIVGIGNTQTKLLGNIRSCNNTLGTINGLLNEKIVVGTPTAKTTVDIQSSIEPWIKQVETNKKDISEIKTVLSNKGASSGKSGKGVVKTLSE